MWRPPRKRLRKPLWQMWLRLSRRWRLQRLRQKPPQSLRLLHRKHPQCSLYLLRKLRLLLARMSLSRNPLLLRKHPQSPPRQRILWRQSPALRLCLPPLR